MRQASKRIPENAGKTSGISGEPHVGIIRRERRSGLCWRAFAVKSAGRDRCSSAGAVEDHRSAAPDRGKCICGPSYGRRRVDGQWQATFRPCR